ncbi:hypothetical protein [Streptomyces sp. AP-93]|uniref:hypothetical protein n=1 Tax=Streptomyces sp. AP-93 TaxID=2929048 RepID=UPI001FB027BF|nr:hypothetical protein [Streptomyces sp. AP-93]MCJ0868511.1 hypothetical protein [Streptomyces sp. AP-93]
MYRTCPGTLAPGSAAPRRPGTLARGTPAPWHPGSAVGCGGKGNGKGRGGICRSLGFRFVVECDGTFADRVLPANHWVIDPRTTPPGLLPAGHA